MRKIAISLQTHILGGYRLFLLTLAVMLGTLAYVVDFSISGVAMPYIAGGIGADQIEGTYVVTAFQTGAAIAIPCVAWFARKYGVFRVCAIAFTSNIIFSFFSAFSVDLFMLVIARFLQGLFAGTILPLSQLMLATFYPERKRMQALSVWVTMLVIAPVVGPVLGGFLCVIEQWRWIFFCQVPLSLIALSSVLHLASDDVHDPDVLPFDRMGAFLFATSITCIQILMDKGQQHDWWGSIIIPIFAFIAFICGLIFCLREKLVTNPLMRLSLFKLPGFALGMGVLFISYSSYYGTITVTPLWLQQTLGYDALMASLPMAALGIIPLIGTSWVFKFNWSQANMLKMAFFFFAATSFYTAYFDTSANLVHITFSRFMMGCGFVFYILPLFRYCVEQIPEKYMMEGITIFLFIRGFCGGVGSSFFKTVWIRRTIFHHEALIESVSLYNPSTVEALRILPSEQSMAILNGMTNQQAAMLAFNDVFWIIGWISLFLIVALSLEPKKAPLLS